MRRKFANASNNGGMTRRNFLQIGALGTVGFGLSQFAPLQAGDVLNSKSDKACILIMNVGGPSQLDTWDMKPDAPREIRGPFKPIRTKNPDLQISEIFPLTAQHADKFSVVRSCHHTAPAVHDAGHQLVQTGKLFSTGVHAPHVGCVSGFLLGQKNEMPPHVILPQPIGVTGGNMSHGQDAGFLGKSCKPFVLNADPSKADFKISSIANRLQNEKARNAFDLSKEPLKVRERYGITRFGQSCLLARRLVEAGVRFVTINTFPTVFDEFTWDIHGFKPFSSFGAMKDFVAPMYDRAYSALLEDLFHRGMLDNTMVTALAEFGRTPKINAAGGRDHWPNCWSVKFAGGGVKGGRVIGKSDEIGAYPVERPVKPAEILATIYKSLGVNFNTALQNGNAGSFDIVEPGAQPIHELFV